jgi:hypothetical protein
MEGGQILEYTPQPETGWHGPGFPLVVILDQ